MSKQSKKSSLPTTQHTNRPHAQHASQRQPKKRKLQSRRRKSHFWFAVGGGLVAIIAAIGLLVYYLSSLPNGPAISPQELKQAIDAQANMTIVDVRTAEEYKAGHIKNSILLPLDTLASKADEALPDKNQTLYVYCQAGSRSVQAVSILQQQGYTNVHSLNGGITAWQNLGYPVAWSGEQQGAPMAQAYREALKE